MDTNPLAVRLQAFAESLPAHHPRRRDLVEAAQRLAVGTGDIVLVKGDGWIGLYLGGQLMDEGHSLREEQVLEALGYEAEVRTVDEAWFERYGASLPERLEEVQCESA